MVVEGEPTAHAAVELGKKHNVELPIIGAVVKVSDGEWTAKEAVEALMRRELKDEFEQLK